MSSKPSQQQSLRLHVPGLKSLTFQNSDHCDVRASSPLLQTVGDSKGRDASRGDRLPCIHTALHSGQPFFSLTQHSPNASYSLTSSKTTCTPTPRGRTLHLRPRSGLRGRTQTPSSSPSSTATFQARTGTSRWSGRTFWTASRLQTRKRISSVPPRRPQTLPVW